MLSPFAPTNAGILVRVRVRPRAGHDRFLGTQGDSSEGVALKVAVAAPPEDGRANAALVAFLAKAWRLPKSTIRIIGGASARDKIVRIDGTPVVLLARLEEWWRARDEAAEDKTA